MTINRRVAAYVLCGALVLAACGSDDDVDSSASSAPGEAAPAETPPPETVPETDDRDAR